MVSFPIPQRDGTVHIIVDDELIVCRSIHEAVRTMNDARAAAQTAERPAPQPETTRQRDRRERREFFGR